MGKQVERIVNAERVEDLIAVFGSFDENIKRIEEALDVHVVNRGTDLRVPAMKRWLTKPSELWKDCCCLPPKENRSMNSGSVISSPWSMKETTSSWHR